jgi:hypothetical protein
MSLFKENNESEMYAINTKGKTKTNHINGEVSQSLFSQLFSDRSICCCLRKKKIKLKYKM